jgi:hypothetical protein
VNRSSLNADTLFPDLNNIPVFPGAVLDESRQSHCLHVPMERQRATPSPELSVEVAVHTGSHSYNEHKRYNINQATPGTTPIVTRASMPRRSSRRFSTHPMPGGPSSTA